MEHRHELDKAASDALGAEDVVLDGERYVQADEYMDAVYK